MWKSVFSQAFPQMFDYKTGIFFFFLLKQVLNLKSIFEIKRPCR